jgi:hypothetical protein
VPKPLPQLRGVQLAKYVSPKQAISLPLQNAEAPSPHCKNEFPKLTKSSTAIPEEPTKSLVRLQKPSYKPTKSEKAIPASATLNLTASSATNPGETAEKPMKSPNPPTAPDKTEKKHSQAPLPPVVASPMPVDSVPDATTPKESTKKVRKSAKTAKKLSKALVASTVDAK